MALYKNGTYLTQSQHSAFDETHSPGTIAQNSGIYRCVNCGDEYACNKGNPLPPQNHRQHAPYSGDIKWQLIVFSEVR
jgi:hypothetical protein